MAAWVRSRKPRQLRILETWFLTVPSLMTNAAAISRLVAPVAIRRSTSNSRSVRSEHSPGSDGGKALVDAPAVPLSAPTSFPAIDGIPILIDQRQSIFSISDFLKQEPTFFRPSGRLRGWLSGMIPSLSSNVAAREALGQMRQRLLRRSRRPKVLVLGGSIVGDGMEVPDYGIYTDRPWPSTAKGQAAMIARMDGDVGRIVALLADGLSTARLNSTVAPFETACGASDEATYAGDAGICTVTVPDASSETSRPLLTSTPER